jgi:hypothetical protein
MAGQHTYGSHEIENEDNGQTRLFQDRQTSCKGKDVPANAMKEGEGSDFDQVITANMSSFYV